MSKDTVESLIAKGMKHTQRGEYGSAIKCYDTALSMDPENTRIGKIRTATLDAYEAEIFASIRSGKELKLCHDPAFDDANTDIMGFYSMVRGVREKRLDEDDNDYKTVIDGGSVVVLGNSGEINISESGDVEIGDNIVVRNGTVEIRGKKHSS